MNKLKQFLSNYRNAIIAWIVIVVLIELGLYLSINTSIVAFLVVLVGILGQAFGALIAWIGLIPIIGPIAAHVDRG